ncbi:hypothetical protein D5S18_18560 [Nocardia panacis]|uniref:Uncharacterized protein n=1 Tax=Nocardia panacis TaxID=2340916 RepID=A0A3A4KHS5_9NOCA|nr:hypothetical protein [Nocardia panacis]RJO74156.1 hypothetical protein D5S18_18560 [Nocardia panacis]
MDREAILSTLSVRLLIAYIRLGKVPARLDVPIGLALVDPDHFGIEHHNSIEATRKLLEQAPMSTHLRVTLVTACTDWLTAITLAALACEEDDIEDSPEWIFASALIQAGRVSNEIDLAEGILDGKIPTEGIGE